MRHLPLFLSFVLALGACPAKVGNINRPPVAVAGADVTAFQGVTVALDGSASSDPDQDALSFSWEQTGGPPVALSLADTANPTLVAPNVTAPTTLVFKLTVTDGTASSSDTTSVTSMPPDPGNHPPTASAVAPPNAASGTIVELDASASSDPDSDSLAFAWSQTSGTAVTLTGANATKASFTAPTVAQNTTLAFAVDVSDGRGGSARATVSLTITPPTNNHAPIASAGADRTVDAGTQVSLVGTATDPDGDAISGWAWSQTGGPTVSLQNASQATATFVAPSPSSTTTLAFSLVATDSQGLSSAPAATHVTVNPGATTTAQFTKVVSLHAVTRTSIVVFFMTDVAVAASVDYGKTSVSEATTTEPNAVTRHVITLSGLSADTAYVYKVRAGTATATGSFKTAIDYAASPGPFSFAVVGDARGHTEWAKVAAKILAKNPRFAVQTGDNNNASGSAANWENYYAVAPDFFANVPIFAAQGNHDLGSNYSVYNIAPQSSSGSDLYYGFVYGNAGFVAINSNANSSTQTSWVQNALTKLSGGPLFSFQHHPLYSCGSHGSSTSMQSTYQSMFESSHLTTNFTGHDHDLIMWSTVNGVRYIVSGGGGASRYTLSGCQGPYAGSIFGFVMVDVDGQNVTETFYDDTGAQLYTTGPFQAFGPSVNFGNLSGLVTY